MTNNERIKGTGLSIVPRTAIQAPVGAIDKHHPSTRCESNVQRFVYEYNKTLPRAIGASSNVNRLSMAAAVKKIAAEIIVKTTTKPKGRVPAGIARICVLGLRASYSRSTIRLKAMAVDRAPTIATVIHQA